MRIRRSFVAATAAGVLVLAALAGCSSAGQPLADATAQEGIKTCVPAPRAGGPGQPAAATPVAFAVNYYYNPSSAPVVVESVSLIDPHDLVLRDVTVYEMRHDEHPLGNGFTWAGLARIADPVAWAQRQAVPGAVIPPEPSGDGAPKPAGPRDMYQIAVGVTATSPGGGWAIGHQVTYRQGSRQYTIRTYSGYAIAPPGKTGQPRCDAEMTAITGAWPPP